MFAIALETPPRPATFDLFRRVVATVTPIFTRTAPSLASLDDRTLRDLGVRRAQAGWHVARTDAS